MSKPKTQDLEWLIYSLMAFNGSGYADMNSPEDFLDSYIAYKTIKHKTEAVMLAQRHREVVLPTLVDLLDHTLGASRQPSSKMMAKIELFRPHSQIARVPSHPKLNYLA